MITRERLEAIDEEWMLSPDRFKQDSLKYWGEVRELLLKIVEKSPPIPVKAEPAQKPAAKADAPKPAAKKR